MTSTSEELRPIFLQVLKSYLSKNSTEVDKTSDIYQLIVSRLVDAVVHCLPSNSPCQVVAGVGKGSWAHVPIVCVYDPYLSEGPQDGMYVVYLFKGDMSGVYISLNQGVTHIKEASYSAKERFLRDVSEAVGRNLRLPTNGWGKGKIDLSITSVKSNPCRACMNLDQFARSCTQLIHSRQKTRLDLIFLRYWRVTG